MNYTKVSVLPGEHELWSWGICELRIARVKVAAVIVDTSLPHECLSPKRSVEAEESACRSWVASLELQRRMAFN